MERDERVKKSSSKAIFTDFSVPQYYGKGRPLEMMASTSPASRNSRRFKDHFDIVSGTVQTTLNSLDQEKSEKQLKIIKL